MHFLLTKGLSGCNLVVNQGASVYISEPRYKEALKIPVKLRNRKPYNEPRFAYKNHKQQPMVRSTAVAWEWLNDTTDTTGNNNSPTAVDL